MERLLNKCPVCGSALEYSALMQYAYVYQLNRDGSFSKRYKKQDIGSMECGFISCKNENCDFATNCDLECETHKNIRIWQEYDKFFYADDSDTSNK